MELESDQYDVVVIGTGLAESIAAAALAKAGKTVLHLDPNEYYGGEQASLTLDELQQWAEKRAGPSTLPLAASQGGSPSASTTDDAVDHQGGSLRSIAAPDAQRTIHSHASTSTITEALQADRRRYALSLFPSVVPSRGKLIDVLIASNVSKYVSFRMLDSVSVWQGQSETGTPSGSAKRVPGSKEEVFKDKSVGLVDKRRLMKFLMFAGREFEGDEILQGRENQPLLTFLQESFSIPQPLAIQITYAIAHCASPDEPTLPALVRTRRYLRSIGRYGSGAFLVGQYGGAGEVAQGFCRACAVFGGTYVLGPSSVPESFEVDNNEGESSIKLKLPCHPRAITANHLIASSSHIPQHARPAGETAASRDLDKSVTTAHCIAIVPSLPQSLRRPALPPPDDGEDEPLPEEDDTAIVVFPPDEKGSSVRVLMMGEGTGSCPVGQFVLYLTTEVASSSSPKEALQPFLRRLDSEPAFEAYYLSHCEVTSTDSETILDSTSALKVLQPYRGPHTLTEGVDWEAAQGEAAFWAVMGGKDRMEEGKGFFERTDADEQEEEML